MFDAFPLSSQIWNISHSRKSVCRLWQILFKKRNKYFSATKTNQGCLRFLLSLRETSREEGPFPAVCDGKGAGNTSGSEVNRNWHLSHSWGRPTCGGQPGKIFWNLHDLWKSQEFSKNLENSGGSWKEDTPARRALGPELRPRGSAEGHDQECKHLLLQVVHLTDGYGWEWIDSWLRKFRHHLHWTLDNVRLILRDANGDIATTLTIDSAEIQVPFTQLENDSTNVPFSHLFLIHTRSIKNEAVVTLEDT